MNKNQTRKCILLVWIKPPILFITDIFNCYELGLNWYNIFLIGVKSLVAAYFLSIFSRIKTCTMKKNQLKLRKKTLFVFKSSKLMTSILLSDPTGNTTTTATSTVPGQ